MLLGCRKRVVKYSRTVRLSAWVSDKQHVLFNKATVQVFKCAWIGEFFLPERTGGNKCVQSGVTISSVIMENDGKQ
eukprot:26143-Pelagomonas_calceolata.AAC.5